MSIDQQLMKDADMQMWLHAASNKAAGSSPAERSFPGGDRNLRVPHVAVNANANANAMAEAGVFVS